MEEAKVNYDEEPVFYCKDCLSLRIKKYDFIEGSEYCESCGSTDVESTDINSWKEMYKARYGHDYLENY